MPGSPGKGRLMVVPSPSFFPSSVKLPAGAPPKLVSNPVTARDDFDNVRCG